MFETDKTLQPQLFAFTPRDLVSPESDIWLYMDLFESLDLSRFHKNYRGQGQLAKEPKLMLRTIFYGLTHGIVTGRKLESACRNDNRFIVLSGDIRPDRRTLNRFFDRHQSLMREFFADIVRMAQKMDLVSLGQIALDGSRFKGQTSRSSMKYGKMQRAISHIEANLDQLRADVRAENASGTSKDTLPREIIDQERRLARIKQAAAAIEAEYRDRRGHKKSEIPDEESRKSLNDPDALFLSHKSRGLEVGYNVQAAVEEKNQIIVAAHVHTKASDSEALPKLLDEVEETCKETPGRVLADLGYKSAANVQDIESRNADCYIAAGSDTHKELEVEFFEQITPIDGTGDYRCLQGKTLKVRSRRKDSGRIEFYLSKDFCTNCPFGTTCKAFGKKVITIMKEADREAIARLHARSRTEEFKEVYRRRKAIVEPVFGNIKNKGMSILVVGREKVTAWWFMACTAHNIEKII